MNTASARFYENDLDTGNDLKTSVSIGQHLEENETKVNALQNALNAGIQSGEPRLFDRDAFLARMRAHGVQLVCSDNLRL